MTATYPDDAVFNANLFSSIGSPVTYSNTGAVATEFNLGQAVNHRGETLVWSEGVLQGTTTYYLSNSNYTVNFFDPPNSSNLTLQTITVPDRLKKIVSEPTMYISEFSNTSVTVINSNNYLIDGVRTAWAFNQSATPTSTSEILLVISGIIQQTTTYTFPSAVLDTRGIDISPAINGANDTISIRVFDNSPVQTTDRCNAMSDKKPSRGIPKETKYSVSTFKSQSGYESRRLLSRKKKRSWELTYTNISELEKDAIESFFDQRYGSYEAFFFDTTHIGDSVGIVVAKLKENSLKSVLNRQIGTDTLNKFYTVTFGLEEVYD